MALDDQTKNLISEMMSWSQEALALRDRAELLRARYFLNAVSARLNDADVGQTFPHLTAAEVVACITAVNAFLDALGDNVSGNAVSLIKMQG